MIFRWPKTLRQFFAWFVSLSISLSVGLVVLYVLFSIVQSGTLIPVAIVPLAAVLGLTANLTFSMAKAVDPSKADAALMLNGLAANLTASTLMIVRAVFFSLLAVPLALHLAKHPDLFTATVWFHLPLYTHLYFDAAILAFLYAALQIGSALFVSLLAFPFLIHYGTYFLRPEQVITPGMTRYAGLMTRFSAFLSETAAVGPPTAQPAEIPGVDELTEHTRVDTG